MKTLTPMQPGNIVLLRQLLIDPQTNLPRGVDQWLSRGGRERGM